MMVESTTIPEDITAFYDKIDKDDEDEEEDQGLKTVSFEVNQVCVNISIQFYIIKYLPLKLYCKILKTVYVIIKGKN